jgi:hypothetical protein
MAVDSIKRNSGSHHIEFAFVDNASNDGTFDYLKSLSPKILIRNGSNLGVTKAWNQLLEASMKLNPDVIALLNNDILCCPGWLDPVARESVKKDKRYFQGRSSISRPDGSTFRRMPLGDRATLSANIREIEEDGKRISREMCGKTSTGGQGWSYFFRPEHVNAFYPIPEQLHLWYNDNYIYKKLEEAGYQQTVLMDCCIVHWGSASVGNYPGFNVQVAKDKEEWIRLFGPFSYAEYVTPAGIDYFVKESRNPENAARIINGGKFGNPQPLHTFLNYIAEFRSGVCVGVTSDRMALAAIASAVQKRNDPKGWAIGIGNCLDDIQGTYGRFTNFNSTPTDGNVINAVKGKTGSLNSPINLFYIDAEHQCINTIIDCYKAAFSNNVIIVTVKHHHAVKFMPFTNPNQLTNDPSWYNKNVVGLLPGNLCVSVGNKTDFDGWSPSSGT